MDWNFSYSIWYNNRSFDKNILAHIGPDARLMRPAAAYAAAFFVPPASFHDSCHPHFMTLLTNDGSIPPVFYG
ncbi:hypothetical protein [Paenibacillus vini]|uniref:Uncharacterized protein n=1 Tax=Paenibacillus vini TaxID=1476024 RepID=A0ABQ4MHL9_9BACL|nr:hypothetical protein [Paenibacillus vini]GIP55462.1 hypothetical protein J42TS3_44970 [Paenibacillus vini]